VRSAVLIAPTIMGPTDLEQRIAARLAERGHVALVADVYGKGRRPATFDEARPLMDALNADRPLLAARMAAALDALRARGNVDGDRVAAFGYCFGGKCVLDMARAGEAVKGVVTFHGVLDAPPGPAGPIAAKVLATHGWDDPLATPEQTVAFAAEMTAAGADWQLLAFGGTVHAFTNPKRADMYSPDADRRSWTAAMAFLDELFG
jgi:dienelactone hydrolase